MRKQRFHLTALAGIAVLAAGGIVAGNASGQDGEPNPYRALPPEIRKAWSDAGALPMGRTWSVKTPGVIFGFYDENPVLGRRFGLGVLERLPDPGKPFGLYLNGSRVTDALLQELAAFKRLEFLSLNGPELTDAGLKHLARLENLRTLDLAHTNVTGTGLKHLAGLKNLRNLYLGKQVTDAGLRELAGLKGLRWLDLTSSNFTDARLKRLAGLNDLRTLDLRRTQVTKAGVAGLQDALPACKIYR